jgi:hypothetical protein
LVLIVSRLAPQAQVIVVLNILGWISFFMLLLRIEVKCVLLYHFRP